MTMLNNGAIIEKLSEEQKLALVTDLSNATDGALNALGVPHVEKSDLSALNREYCGGAYPDLTALAHSWNTKLAANVAGDIVRANGTEKFNIISAPDIGFKCNPYAFGFSEDPYLSAKLANSFVSAVESAGGAACVCGYGLAVSDIEYLDRTPDGAVMSNVLARPFDAILKSRVASAVSMSFAKLRGEWKDVNTKLARETLSKNYTRTVIATDVYEEALRSGLSDINLVFEGASASAVRAALRNYKRMKEDVERGSVTMGELESAVKAGTALSEELLDAAVDKTIEFLRSVSRKREQYSAPVADGATDGQSANSDAMRQYSLLASEESTVLLKNEGGVLPIVQHAKISAVGELIKSFPDFDDAAARICAVRGATFVGKADGYALDSDRSDDLVSGVSELASKSDVVLAFVGLGARREKSAYETKNVKLPANQTAMLDMLAKSGKTVIAVVTGNVLPDMSFDKLVKGVLYVPLGGARGAESLFNILFGIICPSGKLAFTAYDDVDELFAKQKKEVALGRYKVGEFIGYRRYTSQNDKLRYPFGYGLSYTKFEYGNLKINGESVEITVRNTGGRAGFEIAQLYVGKRDSAIVRPTRELKGFAKVMVAPNATVKISFPLTATMLEVYDVDGTRKTESGAYQVYVGSSSCDIRLQGEMNIAGVKLGARTDKLSDYLPTLSNIVSGGYKLNSVSESAMQGAFKSARPAESDYGYEKLFIDEFGNDEAESDEHEENSDNDDILSFLDDSVTVQSITEGFHKAASANGLKLDLASARDIIAAFAASRAVIVRCDEKTFDAIVSALCGYFGCPKNIDNASGYTTSYELFSFGSDTALTSAVGYAAAHREAVTIAALDNVAADKLGTVFAPFIRYATAPDSMTVSFGAGRRTLEVTPNMWFVMRQTEGGTFPLYLADMAAVVIPELAPSAKAMDGANTNTPNYYQLVAAFQKSEREFEIDEPYWKKADRLEEYVNKRTPFKIDNKMCVQMEKFIGVVLACGGEQTDALDRAVAAKLIPHIASAIDGKLTAEDDDFTQTLDGIFGEDEAPRCKITAKRKG